MRVPQTKRQLFICKTQSMAPNIVVPVLTSGKSSILCASIGIYLGGREEFSISSAVKIANTSDCRLADVIESEEQLLRQGDSQVFKRYSQMKLQMKREALEKMNRRQ
jgi:hypothetical protein